MDIQCVADVARVHARQRPESQALWFEGEAVSYGQLDTLSSQCAQALIAAGVQPGDRIGVLAKGNADFFILWLGCVRSNLFDGAVLREAPPVCIESKGVEHVDGYRAPRRPMHFQPVPETNLVVLGMERHVAYLQRLLV